MADYGVHDVAALLRKLDEAHIEVSKTLAYTQVLRDSNEFLHKELVRANELHKADFAAQLHSIEEQKMLRYCIKGMVSEHLGLRVMFSPDIWFRSGGEHGMKPHEIVQELAGRYAAQTASMIEQRLGDRYNLNEAYREAIEYIHYLQGWLARNGLKYQAFSEKVFS